MNKNTADVVVVGGGIVGTATAHFLAKQGISCIVVERDGIASHASGASYAALVVSKDRQLVERKRISHC